MSHPLKRKASVMEALLVERTIWIAAPRKQGIVTESGFDALPDDIRQKQFEQTANGYTKVLEGLEALGEGRSIPF